MQVQFDRRDANKVEKSIDWEAVWAYALGPEPELILSLRCVISESLYSKILLKPVMPELSAFIL